ncbi:MAG: hypothetical protein KC553_03320 [Nitrospina sp.]|nr:hypothetical protein [Nitrospina sp.]
MAENPRRRFSLDKVEVDPQLLNRIQSADGDETLGEWDGEDVEDLVRELERIEEFADANYANLPHNKNIPGDLRDQVEKDLPIWACDKRGMCLVGKRADKVRSVEQIRERYDKKYGGVEAFKEKLRQEREEMVRQLRKSSGTD